MKRKGIVIAATLIVLAILLGLWIGRETSFDPKKGLVVEKTRPGCVKVSSEPGSGGIFVVVEVPPEGQTRSIYLVVDPEFGDGPGSREICRSDQAAAAGMATAPPEDDSGPHIQILGAAAAQECNNPRKPHDFCVDGLEEYPDPFPPSG